MLGIAVVILRENAIRLEEKEKKEKEMLNQIIEEAEEYKVEFYRKRAMTCENKKETNREREKVRVDIAFCCLFSFLFFCSSICFGDCFCDTWFNFGCGMVIMFLCILAHLDIFLTGYLGGVCYILSDYLT